MVNERDGKLKLRDGVQLNYKMVIRNSKNWVVVSHGIAEHFNRHTYLTQTLPQYNIFYYDHRGHGNSEGKKGQVEDFLHFSEDLKEVLTFLHSETDVRKLVLFGHSMGSLIVTCFIKNKMHKDFKVNKVFLSTPPIALPGVKGFFAKKSNALVKRLIKHTSGFYFHTPVEDNSLSHDIEVHKSYVADPLVLKEIHSHLILELVKASNTIKKETFSFPCETYVAIAGEDSVVCSETALDFFSKQNTATAIIYIPGAYHEMHNEMEPYKSTYLKFLRDTLEEDEENDHSSDL